ncbi:MAG: response regulator transcription factor [Actinomycetota bacterium]
MIRVLVVDDQALVRSGFRMILDAEPDLEVVGEAADGREAIERHRALRPDVIVMDVRMPHLDGVEATARINQHHGERARILIVTTFDLDDYVHRALAAGASGFLLKDAPPEQLVDAVRIIAEGEALLAPSVTRRLIERFTSEQRTIEVDGAVDELTDREQEVLGHLARGRSNAEIAATLTVSETTVKTHVGHVLSKLGLRDRVQAVVWAYEHGVVRPGHEAT